jgi:hypothetical protein
VGLRAGLDGRGKPRPLPPTGIRSPDRPTLSELLYRLISLLRVVKTGRENTTKTAPSTDENKE